MPCNGSSLYTVRITAATQILLPAEEEPSSSSTRIFLLLQATEIEALVGESIMDRSDTTFSLSYRRLLLSHIYTATHISKHSYESNTRLCGRIRPRFLSWTLELQHLLRVIEFQERRNVFSQKEKPLLLLQSIWLFGKIYIYRKSETKARLIRTSDIVRRKLYNVRTVAS